MIKNKYVEKHYGQLRGRRIKEVRELSKRELDMYGWDDHREIPIVLILDNGLAVVPSQDPEGNGPGYLFIEQTEIRKKA